MLQCVMDNIFGLMFHLFLFQNNKWEYRMAEGQFDLIQFPTNIFMDQITSQLKRENFACEIRSKQRQNWRKEIRDRLINSDSFLKSKSKLNNQEILQLKRKCAREHYNHNSVEQLLQVLRTADVVDLAEDSLMRLFGNMVQNFQENNFTFSWQEDALMIVQNILKRIISAEIERNKKGQWTKQLYDLFILKNCHYYLLQILCYCPELFNLLQLVACVQNVELFRSAERKFMRMALQKQEQLAEIPLGQFLEIFCKFSYEHSKLQIEQQFKIISFINLAIKNYEMNNADMKKAAIILSNILGTNIQNKVIFILDRTEILQSFCSILQRPSKQNSDELQQNIIFLVGKFFSAPDELCMQIYLRAINILQLLRYRLPIQPLPKVHIGQYKGKLTHHKMTLIKNTLFALSNIVASDYKFAEIFLSTDFYWCLFFMYELVPVDCREEICFCIFSIVYIGRFDALQILVNGRLLELIDQMLLEEVNTAIPYKGMQIVQELLISFEENEKEETSNFLMKKRDLEERLIEKDIKRKIEGYIVSENEDLSKISLSVVEMFGKEETSV